MSFMRLQLIATFSFTVLLRSFSAKYKIATRASATTPTFQPGGKMKGQKFYTVFLLLLEIGLMTKIFLRAVENQS